MFHINSMKLYILYNYIYHIHIAFTQIAYNMYYICMYINGFIHRHTHTFIYLFRQYLYLIDPLVQLFVDCLGKKLQALIFFTTAQHWGLRCMTILGPHAWMSNILATTDIFSTLIVNIILDISRTVIYCLYYQYCMVFKFYLFYV